MFQHIKNIKHPVLRILFVYPSACFLLYCAYDDYAFKNLKNKIQAQEKNDPIEKLKSSHKNLQKCQSIEQLTSIYKHTYNHLTKLMTQPLLKRNLMINYKAKYDKQSFIFQSWGKIYINHYQRQQFYQQGRFYYLFWLNHLKKSAVYAVEANQQIGIIENQISCRKTKCTEIAYKQADQKFKAASVEMIYQQCIRKTETIILMIEKSYKNYLTMLNSNQKLQKVGQLVDMEKQMKKA